MTNRARGSYTTTMEAHVKGEGSSSRIVAERTADTPWVVTVPDGAGVAQLTPEDLHALADEMAKLEAQLKNRAASGRV